MTVFVARALMALATAGMGERRRSWSAAMAAEFEVAAEDGRALGFAAGCLAAAARELLTSAEGHLRLTSYAIALGVMLPMAALQIGCALLGLPYLYPGGGGLGGALLEGGAHQDLLRGVYLSAVPTLALLQLIVGIGHLRVAWLLLERDWARARGAGLQTLAGATSLILFMGALFLDGRQAVLGAAVIALELALLGAVARWHRDVCPAVVNRSD